jgi:hypothetical protein
VKLRVSHPAQVSAPTDEELVARVRAKAPESLGCDAICLQAALGHRFDFALLGRILARATDAELLALHRPARRRRGT